MLSLPAGALRLEDAGRRRHRADRARPHLGRGARRAGINAGQILVTLWDTEERRRYLNARATIERLLEMRAARSSTRTTRSRRRKSATATTTGWPRVAAMASPIASCCCPDVDGLYTAAGDRSDGEASFPSCRA